MNTTFMALPYKIMTWLPYEINSWLNMTWNKYYINGHNGQILETRVQVSTCIGMLLKVKFIFTILGQKQMGTVSLQKDLNYTNLG